MMIVLLMFMQSFISMQFNNTSEHSGDLVILILIILIGSGIYFFTRIISLLNKQDYISMKKLIRYPIIGRIILLYVNYLLVYDIGMLLAGGFSLQKMCEYAIKQEKDSLQHTLGQNIGQQLVKGKSIEEINKKRRFSAD